jgi:tetratricopeptide (TPR) repeat protein
MCQSLGENGDESINHAGLIRFKQIERENAAPERRIEELNALLKQYPNLVAALESLARLEEESGRYTDAAQTLIRAAKVSGASAYWRSAARLWLREGKPDRAIAAARSAIHSTNGQRRVEGELFLTQLHLGVNQNEEAEKLLRAFPALTERESITLSDETLRTFLSLKALCFQRLGKQSELMDTLKQLTDFDLPIPEFAERTYRVVGNNDAPSPTLSTP